MQTARGCEESALAARAGLIVMVVLLCLTPLFRNMPQNAQAAIIISAVAGLFNYSEAIFLWRVRAWLGDV